MKTIAPRQRHCIDFGDRVRFRRRLLALSQQALVAPLASEPSTLSRRQGEGGAAYGSRTLSTRPWNAGTGERRRRTCRSWTLQI